MNEYIMIILVLVIMGLMSDIDTSKKILKGMGNSINELKKWMNRL